MSIIQLQDGKQFTIYYISENDPTLIDQNGLGIGVATDDFNALETALGGDNAQKIIYGELNTVDGKQQLDTTATYSGYTQIAKMEKVRDYQIAPDQKAGVINIVLCKPDLRTDYEKTKSEIMLALAEIYELIPKQGA